MLTDKLHSAEDFDTGADTRTLDNILREPLHKTKRRARRAAQRLAYDKAMLAHKADPEKNAAPVKKARPPEPTVCLWLSQVRTRNQVLNGKLGRISAQIPLIHAVKHLEYAEGSELIQLPLALALQFGGREWKKRVN